MSILYLDTCICFKLETGTSFIKYDNIYSIQRPIFKNNSWFIDIVYDRTKISNRGILATTKEQANKTYVYLTEKLINYHKKKNNIDSIETKLDKLLSYIEVLPGGEEYEKAKDRFSNLEK